MQHPSALPNDTIITGCALVDEANNRAVWGDLWNCGTAYIFNACLEGGEAAWQQSAHPHSQMKQLILKPGAWTFERRGIIVIPHSDAYLTPIAFDYVFPKGK